MRVVRITVQCFCCLQLQLPVPQIQQVLFAGLGVSLIMTLVCVPLMKFNLSWKYSIVLISIYVVFLLFAFLVEFQAL